MQFQGNGDGETTREHVTMPAELLEAIKRMYPEAASNSERIKIAAADGVRARKKYQGHYDGCGGDETG